MLGNLLVIARRPKADVAIQRLVGLRGILDRHGRLRGLAMTITEFIQ
jgi:hypothetical protein